jgi:hypothetical protein
MERALKKRGRPTVYRPEYARQAASLCALGATDANLADLFDVSTWTIRNWMVRHKEFGEAVAQSKNAFDALIERSLAQRAIGYEVDVEEKKLNKEGKVVSYTVRKHYPPDVTACIFWLKNRQPKQWRDVQDHVHDDRLDKLSSEELLEEIRADAVKLGILPEKYGGRRRTKPNGDDTTRH